MGVLITWEDRNVAEEGHHIYRAQTSMAGLTPDQLPPPLDSVGPDVTEYEDGTVTNGETYFYRVGAFTASGTVVLVSEEIEVVAQEAQVPTANLMRFYVMDDLSGSLLPDSSGTQDATASSVALVPGRAGFGDALKSTSASSGKVDIGLFDYTGQKTFSCWLYIEGPLSGTGSLLANGRNGTAYDTLAVSVSYDGSSHKVSALWRGDNSTNSGASDILASLETVDPLAIGKWLHVALVQDEPDVALYLDGELIASDTLTRAIQPSHYSFGFFNITEHSGRGIEYRVDHQRIYNAALTASEVMALANE